MKVAIQLGVSVLIISLAEVMVPIAAAEILPIPIPQQIGAAKVPTFIGAAATAAPITAQAIPQHPFMAPNGRSCMHDDAYMSDTYAIAGPLGRSPEVISTDLGGVCPSVTFDSQGRIVTLCVSRVSARLYLINPTTMGIMADFALPAIERAGSEFSAGGYFYLDNKNRAIVPTITQEIWVVDVVDGSCGPYFERSKVHDLSEYMAEDDSIESALPDFSRNLWFVTGDGIIGIIGASDGAVATRRLEGEGIANSFAIDETGGVFVASDHAMYRFDMGENGRPHITWREAYDRGTRIKPGQVSMGTGTTPTLMGTDFVTIADNADPQMHVLVYRRARKVDRARLVCSVPVFQPSKSCTENSLIATDRSIVVENNYGYSGPTATMYGRTTTSGISRIDIDDSGVARTVWTSHERTPSVVSKGSLETGLIYAYTKDKGPGVTDAWYFTAIDFQTGKTIFKQVAGTGLYYNNHYAGIYVGPDGTAYVGVIGGLVAIRDK
ncbi:MAG: hypothetical protein AB1714_06625 [Acidobacteriota bacterium]